MHVSLQRTMILTSIVSSPLTSVTWRYVSDAYYYFTILWYAVEDKKDENLESTKMLHFLASNRYYIFDIRYHEKLLAIKVK